MKIKLITFLLLCVVGIGTAQNSGKITGKITEKTSNAPMKSVMNCLVWALPSRIPRRAQSGRKSHRSLAGHQHLIKMIRPLSGRAARTRAFRATRRFTMQNLAVSGRRNAGYFRIRNSIKNAGKF